MQVTFASCGENSHTLPRLHISGASRDGSQLALHCRPQAPHLDIVLLATRDLSAALALVTFSAMGS